MRQINTGAVLAAAIENENRYKRAAEAKAMAARSAKAKRAELVAFAATGADVDVAALMQAADGARVANAEFEIANAVLEGAERRRQQAQIAAWFEQAEGLKNAVERRLDERFAAAAEVDSRLAELNLAVTRFNEAGQSFSGARTAAAHFTAEKQDRIAVNPVLAGMPAGTHPKATNYYAAEVRRAVAAVFDAGGGLEQPASIQSLAQREALLWGRGPSEVNLKP
jgi:hypothetical protein